MSIADEIITFGMDETDHDKNLLKLMQKMFQSWHVQSKSQKFYSLELTMAQVEQNLIQRELRKSQVFWSQQANMRFSLS